jgi:fructose-1,6-bisphosphatase/inositol monophosphatase family enzyme
MPTDPESFVTVMAPAVRQAASIARALEGRVQNRPKWGEESAAKAALTLADSAAQEAILVPLLEHFPGVSLRAEEDTPSVPGFPRDSDECVVVDPIDGTLRFYLQAEGPYAVMVGLAPQRRYTAALVALPREGLVFTAVRGGTAHLARAGGAPRPVRAEAQGQRVLVSDRLPEPVADRLREAGYELAPACGGAIAVAPLIPGVRAGLRVAPRGKPISWQGRIGALIAASGGARVENERGEPFPDAIDAPARALLVSADDADRERLRHAVAVLAERPMR